MTVLGSRCGGCPFESSGEIFIPPDGSGFNGVLLLGDSGWLYEAKTRRFTFTEGEVGTPFSGPSGWWLGRQLERMGVSRGDFRIANALWCKAPRLGMTDAPDKYPEAARALAHCAPYLDDLIEREKPRVIVPMGGAALRRIFGTSEIFKYHAYLLDTRYGIPAVPAFHPSFILQGNHKLTGAWHYVLRKALAIAGEGDKLRRPIKREYDLLQDPSPDEARRYLFPTTPWEWLVCDIETRDSVELDEDEREASNWQIVRISFSNKLGTAVSFPWAGVYKDIAKEALERASTVIFWNQAFDAPRLRAEGIKLPKVQDAMWAWHFLQSDLPKKLGFVAPLFLNIEPWKHLSSLMPAYYSAMDAAVTADLWFKIENELALEKRLLAFHRQCTEVIPLLDTMTNAGIVLDVEAQNRLIDDKLVVERDELFTKIQASVPKSVRPFKIYKRFAPKVVLPGEEWVAATEEGRGGILYRPFNPVSSDQRKKLFRSLGLPVPFDRREDKESVQTKHLRKYAKKYPVFRDIIRYTERDKLINAYDWPCEADGRIHPEFGFNPTTWRKNARNPNIMTIPKRNPELAKAVRSLFVAAPGHTLITCDSSAIEAVLVGYFANSPDFITLAKSGIHKRIASEFAGRPVSKDEPLYDQFKRIIYLSLYLGTARRIAEEYPEDFPSARDAQKLQDFFFGTPAGRDVREFQRETLARADYEHYLETPYHQRHYFYDVLTKKDGEASLGDDAKRAVAFLPQATASAIQTEFLLTLPIKLRQYLRAIIHDEIVMEVPESLTKEVGEILHRTMTAPLAALDGLSIGAELKFGVNLGSMEV